MPASPSLNAPPLAELPGWIAGRLRRQQQSADLDGLKFIAERVEGNLLPPIRKSRNSPCFTRPGN